MVVTLGELINRKIIMKYIIVELRHVHTPRLHVMYKHSSIIYLYLVGFILLFLLLRYQVVPVVLVLISTRSYGEQLAVFCTSRATVSPKRNSSNLNFNIDYNIYTGK